jgi:hypothetical protein
MSSFTFECDGTGTVITTALTCPRRAWLSERFAAAGGGASAAALRGTLLHELLQQLLLTVGAEGLPLPSLQQLEDMVGRGECDVGVMLLMILTMTG